MDRETLKLITRAAHAGITFTLLDGAAQLAGERPDDALLSELRDHRDAIIALLAGNCAACDTPPWIHEADIGIPWCRPCARHRGTQLLTAERPDLIEETP